MRKQASMCTSATPVRPTAALAMMMAVLAAVLLPSFAGAQGTEGEINEIAMILTRQAPPEYVAGQPFELVISISANDPAKLTALGLYEDVPPGWVFGGMRGISGQPPAIAPQVGASGTLQFAWITNPELPFAFAYVLTPPAEASGSVMVSGQVEYRTNGPAQYSAPVMTQINGRATQQTGGVVPGGTSTGGNTNTGNTNTGNSTSGNTNTGNSTGAGTGAGTAAGLTTTASTASGQVLPGMPGASPNNSGVKAGATPGAPKNGVPAALNASLGKLAKNLPAGHPKTLTANNTPPGAHPPVAAAKPGPAVPATPPADPAATAAAATSAATSDPAVAGATAGPEKVSEPADANTGSVAAVQPPSAMPPKPGFFAAMADTAARMTAGQLAGLGIGLGVGFILLILAGIAWKVAYGAPPRRRPDLGNPREAE